MISFLRYLFIFVQVCVSTWVCATRVCVCGTHRYQKSASDFPGAGATGSLWHLIPDQTPFLCPTPGHALPQWTVSLPYSGSASKGLPLFTALSRLLVSHGGVACICPYPIGALPPPSSALPVYPFSIKVSGVQHSPESLSLCSSQWLQDWNVQEGERNMTLFDLIIKCEHLLHVDLTFMNEFWVSYFSLVNNQSP